MPVSNETSIDKAKHIRAGSRVNSRVQIAAKWTENGQQMEAVGFTVDISTKGCLVVVPQGFTIGQRMLIENLVNKHQCEAIVVWRGHEGRKGWELGIELQNPSVEFWEVDF